MQKEVEICSSKGPEAGRDQQGQGPKGGQCEPALAKHDLEQRPTGIQGTDHRVYCRSE